MLCRFISLCLLATVALPLSATAQTSSPSMASSAAPSPAYDAALAQSLDADERGMRPYVLAILKTGPRDAEVTDKDERAALFAGHFANMTRLAEEGHLVLAGPPVRWVARTAVAACLSLRPPTSKPPANGYRPTRP